MQNDDGVTKSHAVLRMFSEKFKSVKVKSLTDGRKK